jgi:hypothetical protein
MLNRINSGITPRNANIVFVEDARVYSAIHGREAHSSSGGTRIADHSTLLLATELNEKLDQRKAWGAEFDASDVRK